MEREVAETLYCSISCSKRPEWIELLSKNPNIPIPFLENLLQGYRYTHPAVLNEVLIGLKHDLTVEEVSIYGKPCFDEHQMKQIRLGIENINDISLVKLFANSNFSAKKMNVARELLEAGFEKEKVSIYLETDEYSYNRLNEIELGIRHGLSTKQLNYYAKEEYTADQMKIIRLALESNMDFKQLHIFSKAQFEPSQMEIIKNALLKEKLPINKVVLAARVCFEISQMYEIIDGIKLGLTSEQIELYAKPCYTTHHMRIIKNILKLWPKEEALISKILETDFSYTRLQIIEQTINAEANSSIIDFILSNKNVDVLKIQYVISALEDGICFDNAKELINYDVCIIPSIINAFKCSISLDEIKQAEKDQLILEDFIQAEIGKKLRTLLFSY